jgi:hypothetical protein
VSEQVWAQYENDLPIRIYKHHKDAIRAELAGLDVREVSFAEAMGSIRKQVWVRDGKACSVCGVLLPLNGSLFTRMHFAHIVSRGRQGEDSVENGCCKCYQCHLVDEHAGGKVVPSKSRL